MHAGVGRYRSRRFAIPCGGPGSGRVAKGWDVSATPDGTIVLVLLATSSRGASVAWTSSRLAFRYPPNMQPKLGSTCVVPGDRAAVLKAVVEFTASKVGRDLDPRRLSALTVASVAPDVIAKKRAEMADARPGENAPQAIITCIEAAMRSSSYAEGMMVEQREFKQLMVGDQARVLQYMFFAERVCSKIQGLSAKLGPLIVAGIVGTGLMGGGITMCCAETGMQVFLLDIRTNRSMCLSCVTLLCVGCFASSLDDDYLSREVVVGVTYLESNFVI